VKHTSPITIVVYLLVGGAIGFGMEIALVGAGMQAVVPPYTLPITVVAAALIVVALAIPIRRSISGRSTARINPFRAMRVVVLAKASSLVGALIAGWAAGVAIFFFTRPVIADTASIWASIVGAAGGAILLVAGIVAERLCTLPPDGPDGPGGPDGGDGPDAHVH
jgi:polyferredoxin